MASLLKIRIERQMVAALFRFVLYTPPGMNCNPRSVRRIILEQSNRAQVGHRNWRYGKARTDEPTPFRIADEFWQDQRRRLPQARATPATVGFRASRL
jgi:hypothetical protein